MNLKQQRVAIVDGARTPFVKAGSALAKYSFQELGAHTLKALVERNGIKAGEVEEVHYSTVLLDPQTPNWAREIVFAAGFPPSVYAHSVSNNCISGIVAIAGLGERIAAGRVGIGIAGGSESMSNTTLRLSKKTNKMFMALAGARTMGDRLKIAVKLFGNPKNLLPLTPSVAEPSTGLTMGQHMEITAKELGIARDRQDEIAFKSHHNAAKAMEQGLLQKDIAPLGKIDRDSIVRADTTVEKLSKLKPVFDRSEKGTLTAGNSSALTDGASAVLLMSEDAAVAKKLEPLAYLVDYEYAAINPNDGLLMAPGVAVPRLLKRNGFTFADFDLIEVHEAFAAQVLANIQAWEKGWHEPAIGPFPFEKLNTLGSSLAIGHPFAATGGRIVTTLARELKRRNLRRGLISICAAGAMAAAVIVER